MSSLPNPIQEKPSYIDPAAFSQSISPRHKLGAIWRRLYLTCVGIAALALLILLAKIADDAFGYIAIADVVNPETLVTSDGRLLEDQTHAGVGTWLRNLQDDQGNFYVSTDRLFNAFLEDVAYSQAAPAELRELTLSNLLNAGQTYPEEWAERTVFDLRLPSIVERAQRDLTARADITWLLELNLSSVQLLQLVYSDIVQFELLQSWNLIESITQRSKIKKTVAEEYPHARLEFYSWLNQDFLTTPSSNQALTAGVRVALLGSLWMLLIAIGFSLPLGVGAAIYLEEYARHGNQSKLLSSVNNFIETNIRNLAGVPSIIYGMLGLAVFVRALEQITSGSFIGMTDSDGRTILSAGLTMSLLILPVIIINAQEAIRAVPQSIREASYGLGGTKWQTISRQVLPTSLPGILTGVILSVSRAIGETAPLVVVGAATTIFIDPSGPFSKFTVLPIQIYRWTADPRAGFQDAAAATIIILLTMLISLNAVAIILRNYFSARNRKLV